MNQEGYASPQAVESAIRSAAQKASKADPSISISDRIQQEHFRRFLSRVFSDASDQSWILKGGTGLLARVSSARATTDVDLFRKHQSVPGALEDLKRMAAVDLGDFFSFEYVSHSDGVGGASQGYTEGCQVAFDVYVGSNKRGRLNVDLVVNVVVTDEPTVSLPANGLELPRLLSNEYRLYPVVDQIADKVCATLTTFNDRPSTREWDLVDLVILAVNESVNAIALRHALAVECEVRGLRMPEKFETPATWGHQYAKEAKAVRDCARFRTVGEARALMSAFLDPVLNGVADGMTWDQHAQAWSRSTLPAG